MKIGFVERQRCGEKSKLRKNLKFQNTKSTQERVVKIRILKSANMGQQILFSQLLASFFSERHSMVIRSQIAQKSFCL